jgi:hypothetical protein
MGNECDYLLRDVFEKLEFQTKCVWSIQLSMVVRKSHKVSYVALFSNYFAKMRWLLLAPTLFVLVFLFTRWCVFNFAICGSTICSQIVTILYLNISCPSKSLSHYFNLCIFSYFRISNYGLFFKDFSWTHLRILHECSSC